MKRYVPNILFIALSILPGMHGLAKLIPGTPDTLPRIETTQRTFVLGKKPYPAGTRDQFIAEGRALARAPAGYFRRSGMSAETTDNREYLPPIGNQGAEGSCVHWAGAYYTKTAHMKRQTPSLDISVASNQCSPRFTYNLTNCGSDNGGYGHEPFEVCMRYGVASLQQKPYTAGGFVSLPVVADFVEGLHRRTASYVWVWDWQPDVSEIAELKGCLDAGGVAACAICADDSFEAWVPQDGPWIGPTCTSGDLNHMVTVCGYGTNCYLVANSWGEDWGSNGFIYVDSAYFERYVGDVMYPIEGTYEPATNYATFKIQHDRRSDIQNLSFSVNGTTVWTNSPLPKNLPDGMGTFDTDNRDGWQLAVDLALAPWGTANNAVTGRCADRVSGTVGTVAEFTVHCDSADHVSTNTPVPIPDNTGASVAVWLTATAGTSAPLLLCDDACDITSGGATLQGRVLPNGLPTQWRFQYGSDSSMVHATAWTPGGNGLSLIPCNTIVSGLKQKTVYFYCLSATNSSGATRSATRTFTTASAQILLAEGFEHDGFPPSGWTESGDSYWEYLTAGYGGSPGAANSGAYMAVFFMNAYNVTNQLITPAIDFTGHTNSPALSFWHFMARWTRDQDVLNVKYKTSPGGTPVLLATYSSSVTSWTRHTLDLPNVNATYYIIFEAVANYGHGVCIDDVEVVGKPTFPVSIVSPCGTTFPVAGTYNHLEGTVITNVAISPDTQGTTQLVCYGWTATECLEPAYGTATQAVVTVSGAGTLTWLWDTYYRLSTSAGAHGSVEPAAGWQPAGSTATVTASADAFYHFSCWSGTVSGTDNPLVLLMASPHIVQANFAQNLATNNTPEWWLAQYGWTNNFDSAAQSDADGDGHVTWQEYVTGSNPTNPESVFLSQLAISNGKARVTWTPDLDTARLYAVEGKTNLMQSAWAPTNAATRFFRVKASMP